MFCGYCGTELPDDAGFCSNCGKATASLMNAQSAAAVDQMGTEKSGVVRERTDTVMDNAAGDRADAMKGSAAKLKQALAKKGQFSGKKANLKIDKKKLGIAGVVVVAAIIAVFAGRTVKENRRIEQLEDAIISMSYTDDNEIARLYEEYNTLSETDRRKVSNRDELIRAYQQAEARIAQYKQTAMQVDSLIGAIDYSNIYAEASTLKDAVIAYNNLNDKEREYVTLIGQLEQAYSDVGSLNMAVTAENFWDLFAIEYAVGTRTNYGEGTITTQNGYTIDWGWYGGSITPNYDMSTYNDYATPVYIYVAARYPNLTSECSFYINLHQTYYGIGFVDSDLHEFKLQSATIQYNSSEGVGAYMIAVEDNNASNSLWNLAGMSFDWSDQVHKMNPFDAARVELSDISGSVKY